MFSRFLPYLIAFFVAFATIGCGSDDDATPDDDQIENPDNGGDGSGDGGDGGSDGGDGGDGGSDGGGGDDGGSDGGDSGTPITTEAAEKQATDAIKEHRAANDVPELEFHDLLYEQAIGHAKNMADGTVGYGSDGITERFQALRDAGLSFHKAGEIIGRSTKNAPVEEVMAEWIESTANDYLLGPDYTHFAVAVSKSADGTYYFTAIFVGLQ